MGSQGYCFRMAPFAEPILSLSADLLEFTIYPEDFGAVAQTSLLWPCPLVLESKLINPMIVRSMFELLSNAECAWFTQSRGNTAVYFLIMPCSPTPV